MFLCHWITMIKKTFIYYTNLQNMTQMQLLADRRRNRCHRDNVSTVGLLTTCRGRQRPGDQIRLVSRGRVLKRRNGKLEREKGYKLEEGHTQVLLAGTRSTWAGGGTRKSKKPGTYDASECCVARATVFQFKTEQMRLFEERRDGNRSESRPRRGEG